MPPDTPTATPEPTPPPNPAGQWTSCDPDPAQLRTEGMQLPADITVAVSVEVAPFHDVTADDPHAEELDPRTDTIDGRDAVRIERGGYR